MNRDIASRITVANLRALGGMDDQTEIHFSWHLSNCHSERQKIVDRALDFAVSQLVNGRQNYRREIVTEDLLNQTIVGHLACLGLRATHDTQAGGHCDVHIEGQDNFLWIAEAKIFDSDYSWLHEGYLQLLTRYSSGIVGQDHGGILIYHYDTNLRRTLNRWSKKLMEKRPDCTCDPCRDDIVSLRSSEKHPGTGADYLIRHKGVNLHFAPAK